MGFFFKKRKEPRGRGSGLTVKKLDQLGQDLCLYCEGKRCT
jgi:hypothetical protein